MIYINILTHFNHNLFIHQLDKKRYEGKIKFFENSSDSNIIWDYIIVYENIKPNIHLKYKDGGLIFISGEPEDSNPYCNSFFNQFDNIISSHSKYKSEKNHLIQQALNYHFGFSFKSKEYKYSYNELCNLPIPQKIHNISMICSSKTMMPGHIMRYRLYNELAKEFKEIDFFGSGIKFIDDKSDAILPYKFHICIENSAVDHYWTEKIADSILGYSIPIYYGAPNINEYFPEKSIIRIDINHTDECIKTIRNILQNPEKEYQERLPYLIEARELLLNKYNIFPMLEDFIKKYPSNNRVKELRIKPWNTMWQYKLVFSMLRIKRLLFKILHRI